MNKRIKKLWEEATGATIPAEGFYSSASKYNIEKFAELIIKECMEVASPNYMSTPEDSAYYVELAIDRIADHFGVEE